MKNTTQNYGWLTIALHWVSALTIIGLFTLGFWMVDLGYYDPWYKQGADLHKSIGIVLFSLMVFRLFWRAIQVKTAPLAEHSSFEKKSAHGMHIALYLLIFIIMSSGYLISTADDRAISVFELFAVPSLGELFDNQADIAGAVHKYLA